MASNDSANVESFREATVKEIEFLCRSNYEFFLKKSDNPKELETMRVHWETRKEHLQTLKNFEQSHLEWRGDFILDVVNIMARRMGEQIAYELYQHIELEKSERSKKGGREKHAKSPKGKEKQFVYDCWNNWQNNPDSYKSNAEFARDMLNKVEHLESPKVIEGWCTKWGQEKMKRDISVKDLIEKITAAHLNLKSE